MAQVPLARNVKWGNVSTVMVSTTRGDTSTVLREDPSTVPLRELRQQQCGAKAISATIARRVRTEPKKYVVIFLHFWLESEAFESEIDRLGGIMQQSPPCPGAYSFRNSPATFETKTACMFMPSDLPSTAHTEVIP
uniref:Uncharacterized protein n=1 Tax=Rhizophora mucronata TaxID=61149 RepID=A0A2P2NH96_RHIMU